MDSYTPGMAPLDELKWCTSRVAELSLSIDNECITALDEVAETICSAKRAIQKLNNGHKEMCQYCKKNVVYAKGLCRTCYERRRRTGTVVPREREKEQELPIKEVLPWYEQLALDVLRDNDPDQLPADIEVSVRYALELLTDREKQVILSRYYDGETLAMIASRLGLSRERIRQIVAHALRQLRHPNRIKYLSLGICGVNAEEEEKAALIEQQHRRLKDNFAAWYQEVGHKGIETLGLSVRSFNCLKRAKIDTLDDLFSFLGTTDRTVWAGKLLRIRNLGHRSAVEIENICASIIPPVDWCAGEAVGNAP